MNSLGPEATLKTYENSAAELSEYFSSIEARVDDIELAIDYCPNPYSPKILELGCGDGRDAVEINKRAGWYLGVDYSSSLIEIASRRLSPELFETANMNDFIFPPDLDVVYASASLLHLDKSELKDVIERSHYNLVEGGVMFISMKYAESFSEVIKSDKFGERQFFLYNPDEVCELAGDFEEVYRDFQQIANTKWFTLILKKSSDVIAH